MWLFSANRTSNATNRTQGKADCLRYRSHAQPKMAKSFRAVRAGTKRAGSPAFPVGAPSVQRTQCALAPRAAMPYTIWTDERGEHRWQYRVVAQVEMKSWMRRALLPFPSAGACLWPRRERFICRREPVLLRSNRQDWKGTFCRDITAR
jgi:hypothetical protein